MKRDISINSRVYLPPRLRVVEAFAEQVICNSILKAKVYVDELHNMNADEDYTDETFLIEF